MSRVEDLLAATRGMSTPELLRYLLVEAFPGKTAATCSLRARGVVMLKMISEIDPATPIVFCHAPSQYPESVNYRTRLVSRLGLSDIREPGGDEDEIASGDCDHREGLWSEDPVSHARAYTIVHLNRTLADFECWISGAYHGPYADEAGPRVLQEGRLIRIDPLADWRQDDVRDFMKAHGLPYHPRASVHRPQPVERETQAPPTYHF